MSFDLFNLMPAVYRIRDAQLAQSQPLLTPAETARLQALQSLMPPLSADQLAELDELTAKATRGPLQSLLMLIEEQFAVLAEDLDQLYDDQFIETCAPWVIPYIGDLIGYQSVKGIAPAIDNPRSEVADTISFRRRKGTVLVMEQLARDATAWGAHAVEFFRVLGDTQYMNHIRPWNHYAPDLRYWKPGLYIDRGFDRTAHRVDVRRIASNRGRYNIQNVGIFLWSLGAYSVTRSPATAIVANPLCMRFSSLGMDMPLFHRAVSQGEEITDAARPVNVADRLRRRVLCADVQKGVGAEYYGELNSLAVYVEDRLLNPYEIEVADLSGTDGAWVKVPTVNWPYAAIIDPELGRIAVPPSPTGAAPKVEVSYYYGFNGDMGGGEYAREATFLVEAQTARYDFPDTASAPRYLTLQAAIDFAIAQMKGQAQAAVEITASYIYPEGGASLALAVDLPAGCTLELRAADGARPTLLLSGEISVSGAAASSFAMNGLLIAADTGMMPGSPVPAALVHVPALRPDDSTNHLGTLLIRHCTLVPGWSVDSAGTPHFPADPGTAIHIGRRAHERVGHVQRGGQHHRCNEPHRCGLCGVGQHERWRRLDADWMHGCRQGACDVAVAGFEQHFLGGADGGRHLGDGIDFRSETAGMRAVQLSAGRRAHAQALRVPGAGARVSAADLFCVSLRAPGLSQTTAFHSRCGAARSGRRRRDGCVSLSAGAAAGDRPARADAGISACGPGIRSDLPELGSPFEMRGTRRLHEFR